MQACNYVVYDAAILLNVRGTGGAMYHIFYIRNQMVLKSGQHVHLMEATAMRYMQHIFVEEGHCYVRHTQVLF